MAVMGEWRREELAEFLRTRRARLAPREVGLPEGTRRRTPGLRREEVALLAAVSTAWYAALEQAREVNVSREVLGGIARALRLDDEETAYLFALAGQAPPPLPPVGPAEITPALRHLLDGLGVSPSFVVGRRCEILAWNAAASAVLGDFGSVPIAERNALWLLFADPKYGELFASWECFVRDFLAMFRTFSSRWADDPWYAGFVENLKEASPEFVKWWEAYEVRGVPPKRRGIDHPVTGRLFAEFATLQANGNPDLILCALTVAPGSEDAHKVELLVGSLPLSAKA